MRLNLIFFYTVVRSSGDKSVISALQDSPASAVVCAICFLSVWSVLGMAGFHTYLITTDQTTNEDVCLVFLMLHTYIMDYGCAPFYRLLISRLFQCISSSSFYKKKFSVKYLFHINYLKI